MSSPGRVRDVSGGVHLAPCLRFPCKAVSICSFIAIPAPYKSQSQLLISEKRSAPYPTRQIRMQHQLMRSGPGCVSRPSACPRQLRSVGLPVRTQARCQATKEEDRDLVTNLVGKLFGEKAVSAARLSPFAASVGHFVQLWGEQQGQCGPGVPVQAPRTPPSALPI